MASENVVLINTVGDLAANMAMRAGWLATQDMGYLRGLRKELLGPWPVTSAVRLPTKAQCIEAILGAEFEVTAADQVLDVPVMVGV